METKVRKGQPKQEVDEALRAWKDAERKAVKAMQLATRYYYVWAHKKRLLTHLGKVKNRNGVKITVMNILKRRVNFL